MNSSLNFKDKTVCLITGASKGIGLEIALRICTLLSPGSILILIARSVDLLNTVRAEILIKNDQIDVKVIGLDVSTINDEKSFGKLLFENLQLSMIAEVIVFHNAGTVGTLTDSVNLSNTKIWQDYYSLNLFSAAVINSAIILQFPHQKKHIINITSLCAQKPFAHLALYCSGKAARASYFNVLALERKHDTVVLNYSPGPVKTDMFDDIVNNIRDPETKSVFQGIQTSVLSTQQTVDKLFTILESATYTSGATIDYYDRF